MASTDLQKPKKKQDGTLIDVLPVEGRTSAKYIPEGFDSQEDFLKDMRQEYQADVEWDRINREEALDDKKFSAGEQWDPVVLEQRKGLPCLVINSIPQFIAQLVGDWRESRKAVKILPVSEEDVDVAQVRGELIRSIEVQSRADRVYDSAFESQVQCGDGAFRVSVEYARDDVFDQDIFVRPIEDALSVVWDRFSVDPTGRDARRVFVDDRIPKKEFEAKWPESSPDSLMEGGDDILNRVEMDGWIDQDSYRVTEYWRIIERQRLMAMFGNGKVYEVDSDNLEELVEANGPPMKTRLAWCSYAQMHLVTGFTILSGPYEYKLNRLPIIRMSGRVTNIGGRRVRYGLVRFMKDPVRLKNFWRSVAAEQLGYAPKAQWIAPESAVEGREATFRKAHLSRDPLIVYNDGAEAPPMRLDPPAPQAALLNEAQVNAQDMKDVTGIHDASLGIRSNEVSGRAIQARQREGDIASLTFYDNGNASVLEAGDVMNQLLPQIYDGTRTIRAIGEDGAMKFYRLNDPMNPNAVDMSIGMFDTVLSTGQSYTTKRQEAAQAMMDMIQVAPEVAQVAGDIIATNMDFPGADKLAKRLKKLVPPQYLEDDDPDKQQIQLPSPEQIQQMQQQIAQLGAENQELKADKTLEFKKLEIDSYNAETQRIRALSDNEVDGNQMEMDAIKMILDNSVKLDQNEMKMASEEANFNASRVDANRSHDLASRQQQLSRESRPSTPTRATSTPSPGGTNTSQPEGSANG